MRHNLSQRKLGRKTTHRLSMLSNMASSLIQHERIETTLAKAKELRGYTEKLITKSKKGTLHDRRQVASVLNDKAAIRKLFDNVGPRFAERKGGYTRVLRKSSRRAGDAAEMAIIEFVDYVLKEKSSVSKEERKKARKEKKEAKDLERQAVGAGGQQEKKSGSGDLDSKKASTGAAGGPKKSTTVRKFSK